MKRLALALLLMSLVCVLPACGTNTPKAVAPREPGPVRVACVGDSITFGEGLPERERWCYPAMLQDMLGNGYDVRNFGVSGASALAEGDLPYTEQQAYQDALAFGPDVVFIMLGTNDTKPVNWPKIDGLASDLAAMVEAFRAGPETRVVLCLPPPAWTDGDHGERLRDVVVPRLRAAAEAHGCEVLDLHTPLRGHHAWFPDGVHPNPFAAELIAKRAYALVVNGLEGDGAPINFATVARPSVEFRGNAAGWGGGTWWGQHEAINALGERIAEAGEEQAPQLAFFGDSITQGMTHVQRRAIYPILSGRRTVFEGAFQRYRAVNFGISGDRTEHLLYRIAHGNFDHIDPKVVVLMIGVNNINAAGNTGEETAEGTRAVVAALRDREPQAHVLVLGCFPTGPTADSPARLEVDALHDHIADIGDDDDQVTYLDLRPLFLNADGTPNGNMRGDAIHLTGEGYGAWADALEPVIRDLLAE